MTREEKRKHLDYLREKEKVCGLDKCEVYEINELENEFREELDNE